MVQGTTEPPPPIGLGLRGYWVELEPLTGPSLSALDDFDEDRRLNPVMGGGGRSASHAIAPPMLIRALSTGETVGVVENHPLPGGVAVYVIYVYDNTRPGYGHEATWLYVSHLFDSGARLVAAEVLSLNTVVNGIMRKSGLRPQVRLREHVYAAGRFWDVLVYSFDRDFWMRTIVERHRRRLPGGDRHPAALG